ncbi:hypothetical protein [Streptomyces sp. NBC_01361]|uniref:hypothetical protein n=1 Tax=Streptomyces sp. NBC_01361 TaxID=2903838 RepID=UPI002E2ECDF5|nr:hypothetical protein [Streptomyces sp. NBC_01361]
MLALAPGYRLHRDQVAEVCWPDVDLNTARRNLRVTCTQPATPWNPNSRRAASPLDARGHYRLTVPGTGLTAGTWLGVRFTTQDRAGNSVSQTLLRAAPVR